MRISIRTTLFLCGLAVVLPGCTRPAPRGAPALPNPPAPGFHLKDSDAQAVAIADATMAAIGGRAAWDGSRYFVWRFFGRRLHIWDRYTGRERIEWNDRKSGKPHLVLMNVQRRQGRVFVEGQEITDATERAALLQRGYEIWINDSYWLIMPYKLKDSGVTLRYKGVAAMADGRPADVLVLTFSQVGVTPENKYDVYVGKQSGLVEQWAYYEKFADPTPQFLSPWKSWQRHGGIMLSADRGAEGQLTDLAVPATVPDVVFTQPDPVDLKALQAAR
jgi:hypothetical protein